MPITMKKKRLPQKRKLLANATASIAAKAKVSAVLQKKQTSTDVPAKIHAKAKDGKKHLKLIAKRKKVNGKPARKPSFEAIKFFWWLRPQNQSLCSSSRA